MLKVLPLTDLPKVGEYRVLEHPVTGEIEKLKAVALVEDEEIESTVHVFFASDDEEDNIHTENGIKYYDIRTYADIF
jgi:hypothetical protein